MPAHRQPAIVVEHLTKCYGNLQAVNDVSFTVNQGEVFAFLGPNGAGKTTTVEIIETLRKPTSGIVTVMGMDVTKCKREILPLIGVLPQGFNSYDRITVGESIQYYAKLFGCKKVDIDSLMNLTNLKDQKDVQFKNLSGGLKQRLGIAIALVNDPEVVFLDEPTTGLDPHARRSVWDVLLGLKDQGKTVFLTTHYMEEAELLADTVAIISKGQIVAVGSPGQLVDDNTKTISLTLKAASTDTLSTLEKLHFQSAQDSRNNITVKVKNTEDVLQILTAIKSAGMALPELDVRKPNLEEVFLGLTGESLHEQTSVKGAT